MTSFTNLIQNAAPRNKELLAILEATDHAPPTLEHQRQYIEDLDRDLGDLRRRIQSLDRQREKELKDHEKYRDSVMRRFAYKVTRKQDQFEAKASKEEQEYLQILQQAHKAQQQQDSLEAMRTAAVKVETDLRKEVARHTQAQRELDSLYNSLFQGPTPDFPEEDATEREVQAAQQACNEARTKLDREQQAVNLLNQATMRLREALARIEDALDHSRMDMFGGGTMSDFLERDALHNAESQVSQMQTLAAQARRYSAQIRALPAVRISQGSLMGDVLFDNIFSDMEFHEKIKASREEVRRCGAALAAQVQEAGARVGACEAEVARRAERVGAARAALQKARGRIFECLANGGDVVVTVTAPPLAPPQDNGGRPSELPLPPPPPPTPPKDSGSGSNEPPPPYSA